MISECTKNNMCVDCDDDSCKFKGNLRADCPKYKCDRGGALESGIGYEDCESCLFMKKWAEGQRRYYKLLAAGGGLK